VPLPKALGRFNRIVTNRIGRPLATRLPGFALVVHRGRVTGAVYRTPLNAWHDDRSAIVALTYGRNTDWLKNLAASGGGTMILSGVEREVAGPELIGPEGMGRMPAVARPILRLIDVDEFAVLPFVTPAPPT
jgi:deazaflavin-dependent oxidoreductase (nitroreductase family)